jgi:hypothetical protein
MLDIESSAAGGSAAATAEVTVIEANEILSAQFFKLIPAPCH